MVCCVVCTREPTVRSCVFLRRHKAGGGFAAQNRKTHFRDSEPRFAPGYGAVAALRQSAKPVQSPKAFGGVRIGNYDTKRKTSIDDGGFLLVHLQGFEPGTH